MAGGLADQWISCRTAEVYDPSTGDFTALTPQMASPRGQLAAALLPDGRLLLTGGQVGDGSGGGVASAEIYDPAANTFTALTATMTTGRGSHTATALPGGKILIAGGFGSSITDTAELYDPVADTFTRLGARMTSVRAGHSATLLPSGKVLIAGGQTVNQGGALASAELYDPAGAGTFTALGVAMTTARIRHVATLLPDGTVLIAGGMTQSGGTWTIYDGTEFYDPTGNTFTPLVAKMTTPRAPRRPRCLTDEYSSPAA